MAESFTPEHVDLIGGRRFWVCREALPDEAVTEAFAELEARSDQAGDGPLGLCLVLDQSQPVGSDAVSPRTQLLHAGFDDAGRRHLIRYFDDAAVEPAMPGAFTTRPSGTSAASLPTASAASPATSPFRASATWRSASPAARTREAPGSSSRSRTGS